MNEKILKGLRETRTTLQILAEPLDYLARFVNYKKGYPPLWLRQKVGSLNDFEGSGGEYIAYLKLLCGLKPGMDVLDVGCGCGLMCLKVNENPILQEYIYPGQYVGIDTSSELIGWCAKHLTSNTCHFYWLPNSRAFQYKEPHGDFDVVLCKSLFTHLLPNEVTHYLEEIKKLLKEKGTCLATFFLLDNKMPKPVGRYKFKDWNGISSFDTERKKNPRAAVAYELNWLLDIIGKEKLTFEIHYGSWRGNNQGLSFQDIIILKKEVIK